MRQHPLYSAKTSTSDISKQLFFISLFFFLLLQGYGIYYYKLRIQFEASTDLIYNQWNGFIIAPIPMHRYSYILNKFLIKPCFLLHLPLHVIAIMYCINDALFYLIVSGIIIFFTKKYDYAATVLAAPVILHDSGFYFLVNEIFLSGALMILYMAVYSHMLKSRLRTIILLSSLFFIIWSHPIMLILLVVFFAGIYKSAAQLWEDKFLLLFLLCNIGIRIFCLTTYDVNKIHEFNVAIAGTDWIKHLTEYSKDYWYILLLICAIGSAIVMRPNRVRENLGLIFLLPLIFFSFINDYWVHGLNTTKYLYPVHLFILMQGMIVISNVPMKLKYLILLIAITIFSSGLYSLLFSHPTMQTRATIFDALNKMCRQQDPTSSKWFVKEDLLLPLDPYNLRIHHESILFSALSDQVSTIQVIRATKEEEQELNSVPENHLYLGKNSIVSFQNFDPYYFHFKKSAYKELILDSVKMNYLKALVR